MNGQKTTTVSRLGRWLLGGVGTLIIGLAAVWLTHYLGPDSNSDPCAAYEPPDEDYIQEIVGQAQMDAGATDAVTALLHESILIGHFLLWVADCGKVQQVYERDFEHSSFRVTPHPVYTNDNGQQCRELAVSKKVEGRWHGSLNIYCLIDGNWTLVSQSN